MSGRGRTQRNVQRSAEKSKKLRDDYDEFDDPLGGIDGNIVVKSELRHEISPSDILPSHEEEIFGLVDSHDLVAEHQRMLYGMDMGPTDQRSIVERLGTLERKVDFLLNINSKILARVDKICEDMRGGVVEETNDFPVKEVEELEIIDAKIANNRKKYIDIFKSILKPDGFVKHVERIFVRNLLMQMNYTGVNDKIGLSNYNNLNMALFESQKTEEGFTLADHAKIIREAFLKAKNRAYKAESKKRHPERGFKRKNCNLLE